MSDKKKKVLKYKERKYKERLNEIEISKIEVIKMELSDLVSKQTGLAKEDVLFLLEKPPSLNLGDVAFPCFSLAKIQRKSPNIIAAELAKSLEELVERPEIIEKVNAVGGYVNFYFNRELYSYQIFTDIFSQGEKYGNNSSGEEKRIVIEMSSPNIAKSFGIGHLRSTIIGEALSRIYKANGYDVIKINYLGDWGTQFGKLIYGIKKWGVSAKLKEDPINYLQELYVKTNLEMNEEVEAAARNYFRLMEEGDEETLKLWREIRDNSLKEFNKIYSLLGVSFDDVSGESEYVEKSKQVIRELMSKGIAKESEGSIIVDLTDEGKSVGILRKSDGTTIYLSRDIAAAIDRKQRYEFNEMIYEVGAEQKLHFQQLFTILSKMGYEWSSNLKHIAHGLYLGADGKKLSTRQGSSVKMKDIWDYTFNKVTDELKKRQGDNLLEEDFEKAKKITRAAIFYADLSNYRENDIKYNLDAIVSMEGDTGPYLLYSYARCKSILRKLGYTRQRNPLKTKPTDKEYSLISKFIEFPDVVLRAKENDDPSVIAKYSMELAKEFNSFYAHCRVKGSGRENYRAQIIDAYSSILRNSLNLIGIETIERM
ncbi:MAG: arginyl-tRNA synthetase [Candidatus Woesearchaeota archaeon]|nr:arginyl-tRNA synthetase [Candidatus Woesearchaeota archaeon]